MLFKSHGRQTLINIESGGFNAFQAILADENNQSNAFYVSGDS
jgi:hypothetical protein